MVKLAPSILAADFLNLESELNKIEGTSADYIHFDVMDGQFVENISFGFPIVRAAAMNTKLPLDVHLMIEEPERYIDAFAESGARVITVHAEATAHVSRALKRIRALNCLAGIALNPATSPECIRYAVGDFDLALIMLVNPGFGGQKMMTGTVKKIAEVRKMLDDAGAKAEIEVDGEVNLETAPMLIAEGATMLVAGTAFFKSSDPVEFARKIKAIHNS